MQIECDDYGYPAEASLDRIQEARPCTREDCREILEAVRAAWRYGSAKEDGGVYRFATGGWSGNEAMIVAMHQNGVFSGICWRASITGGLHIYELPGAVKEWQFDERIVERESEK